MLFECISCVTAGSYILALFAERWLRHVDRLTTGLRRRESVFGQSLYPRILSAMKLIKDRLAGDRVRHRRINRTRPPLCSKLIKKAVLEDFCLIETTQFDAFDYPTIHWSMTVVFVICVAISAIFQTGEVVHLMALKSPIEELKHL